MPKARREAPPENSTRKKNSLIPAWRSLARRRRHGSEIRDETEVGGAEDEPAVERDVEVTLELNIPRACTVTRPKKSMLAAKSTRHAPKPSAPPTTIRKLAWMLRISMNLTSPFNASSKDCSRMATPANVRGTVEVFTCTLPAALILMTSSMFTSTLTSSSSARPGFESM
jgi:hypothetical protein